MTCVGAGEQLYLAVGLPVQPALGPRPRSRSGVGGRAGALDSFVVAYFAVDG